MIKSFFLNKKWAMWAWGGFLFIIGSLVAQTWIDVKINEWYKGFYDLLQKATESDVSEFYDGIYLFMKLAIPYVIIYTMWLKRLNSSNIVIGGFAGSAASMAGWSAATGSIDILGFLIGFLVFVWTPSHFWCLAMKLRDDYAEANVPMLPVLIGMERTSKYILANTIILLPYSLLLYAFGMGIVYTIIASIAGGLMLVYHYKLTKTPTSDFAWKAYKVTAPYLTIIFIGIALDAAFHFRF